MMTQDVLQERNNVCLHSVAQDLCVGCGVCAGVCPARNLTMEWTANGCYHPSDSGHCLPNCHRCLDVCPFQDHDYGEDALAADLFGTIAGVSHTAETGYYLSSYVGHAKGGYRERGASGGLASWTLATLLERDIVDRVICVRTQTNPERLFGYSVLSDADEVRNAARSAYYPVELSGSLNTILSDEARYAIIALPCFLKAFRLAAMQDARLRNRVVATIGLVCGQLKSKAFTHYLVTSLGLRLSDVSTVTFRGKETGKPASELIFKASASGVERCVPWSGLYGATWLTGEFKLRACDYCDDIFAEVADMACMDAWLPAYTSDWRGTSIALVRSKRMELLLKSGIEQGELDLQPIGIDQVIASQAGVIQQKRSMLSYRLWLAQKHGIHGPRKRVDPRRPRWLRRRELELREHLRAKSLAVPEGCGDIDQFRSYNEQVLPSRRRLAKIMSIRRLYTRVRRVLLRLSKFGGD